MLCSLHTLGFLFLGLWKFCVIEEEASRKVIENHGQGVAAQRRALTVFESRSNSVRLPYH